MILNAIKGILGNITLLVTFAVLYSITLNRSVIKTVQGKIATGAAAGLLGIALMLNSWELIPGVFFDARSILLANLGLFFGPVPTVVAAGITAAFRAWQGGGGVYTGIAVIVSASTVGLLWRHFRPTRHRWVDFALLGFIVHLLMLAWMLLLPRETPLNELLVVGAIVLTVYPVGTGVLAMLLENQAKFQLARRDERTRNQRLRHMLEHGWDILHLTDSNGKTLYVSEAVTHVLGYQPGELVGHRLHELIHPDDTEMVSERYRDLTSVSGAISNQEVRVRHKDGRWLWFDTVATNQLDNPSIEAVIVNSRPIEDRKQAEVSLQQSEHRFRSLFELSGDANLIIEEGAFVDCNQAALDMLGFDSKAEFLKRPLPSDHSPERQADGRLSTEKAGEMIARALECGTHRFEWLHTRKTGQVFPVEVLLTAISREKGNEILHTAWRDITERKHALRALQVSETMHRSIFESAPMGIALADSTTGRYLQVNARHAEILGRKREEMVGLDWMSLTHPDDLQADLENMAALNQDEISSYQMEKRYIRPDGTIVWARLTTSSINVSHFDCPVHLSMIQDITEQKEAEEERAKLQAQLQQSQRLESIGRLAGGVAHDSNNMMAVILGNAEIALAGMDRDDPLYPGLEEIEKAAQRSARLNHQLLAFARQQTISPKVLDLTSVISEDYKMLRRLIGENINLIWEPTEVVWPVRIDPSQIDQILANLTVNARDAINGVGTVIIRTANRVIDDEFVESHPDALPGDFVLISVKDDGVGMTPDVQAQIFDPFFTTKGPGQGSGLGLATVFGIVKQNSGFILVDSMHGEGSEFDVFLPRHVAPEEEPTRAFPEKSHGQGRGTILVVEDEPSILTICRKMLEGLGYTVLTDNSPETAIEQATNFSGQIDLLISDVIMPEMNGKTLAEKMGEIHSGLKVLFMSGYAAEVINEVDVQGDQIHFIQKPFSLSQLAESVRAALES